MPKISIIVPVYNVECYLTECIESVLMQDYKDYELILIDDGSTDSSGRICDEYGDLDHVKILHTSNHGVSFARNMGLKEASGEYIMFLDGDDFFSYARVFSHVISEEEQHPSDLLKFGVRNIHASRDSDYISTQEIEQLRVIDDKERICAFVHGGFIMEYIFPRRMINGIVFDERVRCGEDLIFLAEVLSKAEKLYELNTIMYMRRIREGSIVHSPLDKQYFVEWQFVYSEIERLLKSIPNCGKRIVNAVIADQTISINKTKMCPNDRKCNIKRIKRRILDSFPNFLFNPYLSKKTKSILLLFLISPQLFFATHSIAHYKKQ